MTAHLIQAPDSKKWHIGVFVRGGRWEGSWLPICDADPNDSIWRIKGSQMRDDIYWRKPSGLCAYCSKEIEWRVRLIASVEQEAGQR